MRKWIIRLSILTGILYFIFLSLGIYIYLQSRLPIDGKIKVHGLHGTVKVIRDAYGIPHITAEKSDLDAFFALGYVHAQDRLWQMEFNRRVAQGTLSEVLGKSTVNADTYLRTLGLYQAAEKAWPSLSQPDQEIIQRYTDGVNAMIAQQHFPLQFRLLKYHPKPWTVIDSIVWQQVLAWDLQSTNGPKDGNAWAVSGKYTHTGKPLLATDPHLELQSPSLWYLVELKGPSLHVAGASMPGFPAVMMGHNDHIAWGMIHAAPPIQNILKINYAQNWTQFADALKDAATSGQQFIYADTDGNIGDYLDGKYAFNPPSGRIILSHNPFIQKRIGQLLTENNNHLDVSQFSAIQQDNISLEWLSLSPQLLKTIPRDTDSKTALGYLRTWDGSAHINSIGQTIFAYWRRELGENPTHPSESLQTAMQKLIHDRGSDPQKWLWGDVHPAVFNALGLASVPGAEFIWGRHIAAPGGLDTVNPGTYNSADFVQTTGAGYRQIIDLGNFSHSIFIQSLGQSNNLFSPHFQDMMTLWRDGNYLSMDRNCLAKKSINTLTLRAG